MATRRSRSPSTPSEGEIIESGSETKATTSQTSLNGTSVDRPTRPSLSSAPRSPISVTRSPRPRRSRSRSRSRTRSRSPYSPYRDFRGEKRRRDDDYFDDRRVRHTPPRRYEPRYDDRYYDDRSYDRGYRDRRRRPYHDYDREEGYGGSLRYTDDYDKSREKRHRTRSRSPYRDVRKPKQYSSDEMESKRKDSSVRWGNGRRDSTEQSVSERGKPPVVAQKPRKEAETRENQVQQQVSIDARPRKVTMYVFSIPFFNGFN